MGRLGRPKNDAQVPFVQLPLLDLLVEDTEGGGVLCRDDNAAGVPVNPVAKSGDKGIPLFGTGI